MIAQDEWSGSWDFSQLHGKRIAVVLRIGSEDRVLHGTASCEFDEIRGRLLRIPMESEHDLAAPDLIIVEKSWCGVIRASNEEDCDVCLIPAPIG
jgi:hypothetical protein